MSMLSGASKKILSEIFHIVASIAYEAPLRKSKTFLPVSVSSLSRLMITGVFVFKLSTSWGHSSNSTGCTRIKDWRLGALLVFGANLFADKIPPEAFDVCGA